MERVRDGRGLASEGGGKTTRRRIKVWWSHHGTLMNFLMVDMDAIKCVLWCGASAIYFVIIPLLTSSHFTVAIDPDSHINPSISNFIDTPQASGLMGVLVMGMFQYLWSPIYRLRWYQDTPSAAVGHDMLVGITVLGFAGFLTCSLSFDPTIPIQAHYICVAIFLFGGFIHMALLFAQVLHHRRRSGMTRRWTVGLATWCALLVMGGCGFLGMIGIEIFRLLTPSFD